MIPNCRGAFLAALLAATLSFGACDRQPLERAKPETTPTPAPTPSPTPIFIPRQTLDTATLYNGVKLRSTFSHRPGGPASVERETDASYMLDLKLEITVPTPHSDLHTLSAANPSLPTVLPELARMLEGARISPLFEDLYGRKIARLENALSRLDRLLSRHNFYDCETILELEHPVTGRKVMLVQAEMDVDADGSDADRLAYVDGSIPNYQPMTSYRWAKTSDRVNPFLVASEKKLEELKSEYAIKGLSAERNAQLRQAIGEMTYEVNQLRKNSFLLSEHDPFVVISGAMFAARKEPFVPGLGDYCVVIHGDTLYPAIVGDVGPTFKMGEASLRMSKAINPRSTVYSRPVSDLTVTYLFFPNTADSPFGPPDLERYRSRCEELIQEIGGHAGILHTWENTLPPLPEPTSEPAPEASPSPGAAVSPTPAASPTPATPAPVAS